MDKSVADTLIKSISVIAKDSIELDKIKTKVDIDVCEIIKDMEDICKQLAVLIVHEGQEINLEGIKSCLHADYIAKDFKGMPSSYWVECIEYLKEKHGLRGVGI